MSDSCCGGCGGQNTEPKKEKTVAQEQALEQEQKKKQDKPEK